MIRLLLPTTCVQLRDIMLKNFFLISIEVNISLQCVNKCMQYIYFNISLSVLYRKSVFYIFNFYRISLIHHKIHTREWSRVSFHQSFNMLTHNSNSFNINLYKNKIHKKYLNYFINKWKKLSCMKKNYWNKWMKLYEQ